MNKEWIKFADQLPDLGEYIWLSSPVEKSVSCEVRAQMYLGSYTHWMPCERPDQPLKSPEELAMEEYLRISPHATIEKLWCAAIKWERERKK